MICPECAHEWNPNEVEEVSAEDGGLVVKDSNGKILKDGDTVVIIKDLPVKGFSKSIKVGTKVNNIRLVLKNINHKKNIDLALRHYRKIFLYFYH